MRSRVVLPEPFRPTMPSHSPSLISRSRAVRASISSNRFEIPSRQYISGGSQGHGEVFPSPSSIATAELDSDPVELSNSSSTETFVVTDL